MTEPLTPPDCDLRDFAFMPLDAGRLFGSEFHALASDAEWRAGVCLWLKSWHQVPAASLPDDDVMLCRLAEMGRDQRSWKKVREVALRGWVRANDGRLYHPVVAEKALEAWLEKLAQRLSSGAGNAKRWKIPFDPKPIKASLVVAADMLAALAPHSRAIAKAARRKSGPDPDGTPSGTPDDIPSGSQGTGTGNYSDTDVSGGEPPKSSPNDHDALAWSEAKRLLIDQGGMTKAEAGAFFGKLLTEHGLTGRDLLGPIADGFGNGTGDPKSWLAAAAKARSRKRVSPSRTPDLGYC